MTEWVTPQEASEILGVSLRTVQRYVKSKKLKTKIVDGKSSVNKEAVDLLMIKKKPTELPGKDKKVTKSEFDIPEGYILIDKSTLDSLRNQIGILSENVSQMQLTQKLLIERGLNLKELPAQQEEVSTIHQEEKLKADSPISPVIKAHDEFFAETKKRNNLVKNIGLTIIAISSLLFFLYGLLSYLDKN